MKAGQAAAATKRKDKKKVAVSNESSPTVPAVREKLIESVGSEVQKEVSAEGSFDFEQAEGGEGWDDEDGEDEDQWSDSDGWGSEFDEDDDAIDGDFSVEADRTGQLSVADLVHKVYWEGEMVIDEQKANKDSSGRFKYLLECKRSRTRPMISVMIAMEGDRLQLQYHGLRGPDAKALAAALSQNESVQTCNLSGNPLGLGGGDIAEALVENTTLTRLDMHSAQVAWRGGEAFSRALAVNEYLTHLDLHANRIGDSSLALIANACKENQTLRFLDVSDNEGSIKAAAAFASALPLNFALTHLDLAWNHIRPQELRLLSEGVLANSTLQSLSLAWNGVGDKRDPDPPAAKDDPALHPEKSDAKKGGGTEKAESPKRAAPHACAGEVLAELIRQTETLRHLDVTNCRIGAGVSRELAAAIRGNKSLRSIRLDENPLGAGANEVMSALQARSEGGSLQHFSLANCSYDLARTNTADYDAANPSGSYRLDLAQAKDQEMLKLLLRDAKTSKGEMWRNERLNGTRIIFPTQPSTKFALPSEGILEVDLVYYDKRDADAEPVDEQEMRRLTRALEECKTESARFALLKRACQAYMFTIQQALALLFLFSLDSTRENVVVLLFGRLLDRNRIFLLEPALSHRSRVQLHRRVGPMWMMHRQNPTGRYWMDLGKLHDRRALTYLLELRTRAPSCSFANVRFTLLGHESALPLTEASPLYEILVHAVPVAMTSVEGLVPTDGILEFDFLGNKAELQKLARAVRSAVKTGESPFRSLRSSLGSRGGLISFNSDRSRSGSEISSPARSPRPRGVTEVPKVATSSVPQNIERFPSASGVTGSARRGGSTSSGTPRELESAPVVDNVPQISLPESVSEHEHDVTTVAAGAETERAPDVERPAQQRRPPSS